MKRRRSGKKLPQRYLQSAILKILRKRPGKSFSPKTLATRIKSKNTTDSVLDALVALEKRGIIVFNKEGKARISKSAIKNSSEIKRVTGLVDITASGAGYISVKGEDQDIYVPKKFLNSAMHNDEVAIDIVSHRPGRKPEGRVLEVLKRAKTTFIGLFQSHNKYGYVFVENHKYQFEVRILPDDYGQAENGSVVIVEVTDFGMNKKGTYFGFIKSVLSTSDKNEFEMNSILINNGFNIAFPDEVLRESEAIPDKINTAEIAKRKDIREITTFTIDPIDAKDFDDALSVRSLDNGTTEIGIHIADVTHYVQPGTELNKEAYKRSTSVYLVDRVCPMLPERLSNELCSLRPNEDKLCFSAIFQFDEKKKIVDEWFGRTVIHSDRRFTYEEAQENIEVGTGDFADELRMLNNFALQLKADRFKSGSIDFDGDEIRFELDENNKPVGVVKKERKDAHKLVEEFMLLANKRVATFLGGHKDKNPIKSSVYRVHDLPDADRLVELALLAAEFDIKLKLDTPNNITESLNNLSSYSDKTDILAILKPMAIRCMAKAAYSVENIGHYGLGFDYYTHFTSPIRRYSDVLVHRLLQTALSDKKGGTIAELEDKCAYISQKERNAITAERESIKYKQIEYLADKVGEEFDAIIRNMIDRGMFIELDITRADGMIGFERFNESFTIHPAKIKAVGDVTRRKFTIGDRVKVRLIEVDEERRQLEFAIVDENKEK